MNETARKKGTTTMKSSCFSPSFLRRCGAAAAAGLIGAATLTAETPAHASVLTTEWLADVALSTLVGSIAGQGITNLVYGSGSNSLSPSDLDEIASLIDSAFSQYSLSADMTYVGDVVSAASNYHRGKSSDDLKASMDVVTNIVKEARYTLIDIANKHDTDPSAWYKLAPSYKAVGMIYVAFLQEQQAIATLLGSGDDYGTTVVTEAERVLSQLELYHDAFEAQFPTDASSSFSAAWENDWHDSQGTSHSFLRCTATSATTSWTTSLSWCVTYTPFNGTSQNLCPQTDYTTMSVYPSTGTFTAGVPSLDNFHGTCTYNTVTPGTDTAALGVSRAWFKNFKSYQRDQQLGAWFFESVAALEKAAGAGYAICGDGVCSPSEAAYKWSYDATTSTGTYTTTPQCAADCAYVGTSGSSSDTTKQAFAVLDFGTLHSTYTNSPVLYGSGVTYYASSGTRMLLAADGASLWWTSDGDLILYSKQGSLLWQTGTAGSGSFLGLQGDGNMVIYNSSGSAIWSTGTHPSNPDVYTYRPVHLMITDGALHLVDSSFHVWWSSDTDSHVYGLASSKMGSSQPASAKYCWTKGSSAQTIASNNWQKLSFDSDGALRVYYTPSNQTLWASGVAGYGGTATKGQYLCNQEDGNLVLYDASWNNVWDSGAGYGSLSYNFNGWGGDLQLAGSQLQTLAPSGDPTWGTSVCLDIDNFACSNSVNPTAVSMIAAPSSGASYYGASSTLLTTAYAKLTFGSGGELSIADYSANAALTSSSSFAKIWSEAGTGSTMAMFDSYGDFAIGFVVSNVFYSSWSPSQGGLTAGKSHLALAGCNLMVLDASDHAVWTTTTACSYGLSTHTDRWIVGTPAKSY